MKDKKILIWNDKAGAASFEKDVIGTMDLCNFLTETFHSFQDWKKITTLQDWIELCEDPGLYFDGILQSNVEIKATGGKQGNPEIIAKLFDIDRENYLNLVAGRLVSEDTCKPCKRMKTKRGSIPITLPRYEQHELFLIFNADGYFSVNEANVSTAKGVFQVWADTPARLQIWEHWNNLVNILNLHNEKYPMGQIDKNNICKATKLQLSEGSTGNFVINLMTLAEQIKYL